MPKRYEGFLLLVCFIIRMVFVIRRIYRFNKLHDALFL